MATLIARHSVNVEAKDIEARTGASIGDALLSRASTMGADLLVIGAYGHARGQERVMDGATGTILKSMTVLALMSY